MIPFELALVGWLVFGTLLMIQRDNAKALTLNYVLANMILPSAVEIDVPILPALNKTSVVIASGFIGTIIFHPQVFNRLRLRWFDLLVPLVFCCTIMTSVRNGFGLYDGLSNMLDDLVYTAFGYALMRMHISSPRALRSMLTTTVWCSVAYVPFALWEFRMSPQIHSTLYGYFQHVFAQHYRNGLWRPVVCFSHALALGRFFALCAFLALFPLRKHLARQMPFGQWAFLAPLLGVVISMSFSPMLLFAGYSGMYILCTRMKAVWINWAFPIVAYVFIAMIFLGSNPLSWTVDLFASISVERAESLQYRIDALEEYRENIVQKPIFGWGGWGSGRITGRATDSAILIRSLSKGIFGACLMYAFYFFHIAVAQDLARRTRGTPIGPECLAMAVVIPLAISLNSIDQGMGPQVGFMMAAAISLQVAVRRAGPLAFATRRQQNVVAPVAMHRPARAVRMTLRAREARNKGDESWPT